MGIPASAQHISNGSIHIMSATTTTTMKAVHYVKPFQVTVKDVPIPKIEHPDDAILKVTTAGMHWIEPSKGSILTDLLAICGSDLHMYQGRTAAEGGLIFGTTSATTIPPVQTMISSLTFCAID